MRHLPLIFFLVLGGSAAAQTAVPAPAVTPGFSAPPAAQPASAPAAAPELTTVEQHRDGKIGRDVFIGAYITVDRTCKVGPTPKVEFTEQPKSGKTKTRPEAINLTQASGIPRNKCLGVSPAGIAVIYRGNPRFKGNDAFVYRVTYPDGRIREVKATVTVQ